MIREATASLRHVLESAIDARDKPLAVRAALDAVESGEVTIAELYGLLGELMSELGAHWQDGTVAVWQEHLASSTVRTIVETLYSRVQQLAREPRDGRTVVLACPENEEHDLGLRMLSDRFDLAGWTTVYLGADTPTGDIALAAQAAGAELVVLSVSTHLQRTKLRDVLEALCSTVPAVRVAIGGPASLHEHPHAAGELTFDPSEFFAEPIDRDAGERED
jgi:methanogenic corrinoid protein MtbC1